MKIVAIDPGGTTGIATAFSKSHLTSTRQLEYRDHHTVLWDYLQVNLPDIVICESFTYRQGNKVDLSAPEYIGIVRLWCERNRVKLVMQQPAQAKTFWSNDKIKSLDLWEPGKPHAMDALRHLLRYITQECNDNFFIERLK